MARKPDVMINRISEAYKRWRHTRGYGVHSPFAYSVVKGVVRPGRPYAWYAYKDIDNAVGTDSLSGSRRMAKTLLRLAAFLDARHAFLPNDDRTSPFRCALKGANSGMRISSALSELAACPLVCSAGDYVPLERLKEVINTPGRTIAIRDVPPSWPDELFSSLREGLMLRGKRNVLIFCRPGMQKISYTVRI